MVRQKHLPALDGLRGLAVLFVFVFHYGGGAKSPNQLLRGIGHFIQAGWSGVTLFFILSGFLISGIIWDSRSTPGWRINFYMRRALRIFPLYYGSLCLVFLTAVVAGKGLLSLSRIWVYLCFLQNIPSLSIKANDVGSSLWLFHFWSLAVEEQFYLLWPYLLTRMRDIEQAKKLCLSVFLFSCLFRVVIWYSVADYIQYSNFLFTRAGELAIGSYLAMCFRDPILWPRLKALAPVTAIISISGFLVAGIAGHSLALQNWQMFLVGLPGITFFFAALVVLALSEGYVSKVARVSGLRWLGGISYGVYVFHILFFPVFGWLVSTIAPHANRNLSLALNFIVAGILSTLLAWISFRYFETPFLKQRSRFKVLQTT